MSRPLKRSVPVWLILLALSGVALQNIPGTYVLDEIGERVAADSPAGIAISSLGKTAVRGSLYFREPARHRISRNAEIGVPAETSLSVHAVMEPFLENGEWILEPAELSVVSDRPLTFMYRGVTLARARHLRLNDEGRLEAEGHYQVLSALRSAHRYQRQRTVRRDYRVPAAARIHLSLALKDLEPMVNRLLGETIPDAFDLGSVFEVRLDRLHHLQFSENHLDLHVDGTLRYARSRRVSRVLHPGFRARLGVDVHLPREQCLAEAGLGVSLRNVHTFNFSGLNPVFDKMIRDTVRSYRNEARVLFSAAEVYPGVLAWPGTLFIEDFHLQGERGDAADLLLQIRWEMNGHPEI